LRGTCGGCNLTRFTIEEIQEALKRAGLDRVAMSKVIGGLFDLKRENRNVGGRPPEDDSQRLETMAILVLTGETQWGAAGYATEDLQEPARTTARKRINAKFKEFYVVWLSRATGNPPT
jgi:hypothetical protein